MTPSSNRLPTELLFVEVPPGISIFERLQLEEALLRTTTQNWCLVGFGTPPTIVLGLSSSFEKLVNREKLDRAPLPVVRRFSGGGTVIVDETSFFFTFIANSAESGVEPKSPALHAFCIELLATAWPTLNLRLVENDYAIDERKCGGNAQYIMKERWLHHTSFLWDYTSERMEYLSLPERQPLYRAKRDHDAFLCRLKEHFPLPKLLVSSLQELLILRYELVFASYHELLAYRDRPHRQATARLF